VGGTLTINGNWWDCDCDDYPHPVEAQSWRRIMAWYEE